MNTLRTWGLRIAGAALSGILFAAALPPGVVPILGWFAFVPLFLAVRGTSFLRGFVLGLLGVLVTSQCVRHGLFFPDRVEVGTDGWIYNGIGLFGIVISLVSGVVAELKHLRWPNVLAMAALAVLFEAALLLVLPAHLALTQYRSWPLMLVSSVTGIWGASFLMWGVNVWLTEAASQRSIRSAAPALLVAFIGSLPFLGGIKTGQPYVAMVQSAENSEEALTKLNAEAGSRGAKLAIWPEFGGQMMAPQGDASAIAALSAQPGQPAIVTSFPDGSTPLPFNVAALYSGREESVRYQKRRLFGGEKNMHQAGKVAVATPFDGGSVGLNICFDSCYPYVIRDTANLPNVNLLALPTIDPESPHHFVAAIHAAFTPFRAAENGIPMVRADGVAYSQVVDASGRILVNLRPGEQVASIGVVRERRFTIYRAFGDWFVWACGVCLVGVIIAGKRAGKGSEGSEPADRSTVLPEIELPEPTKEPV